MPAPLRVERSGHTAEPYIGDAAANSLPAGFAGANNERTTPTATTAVPTAINEACSGLCSVRPTDPYSAAITGISAPASAAQPA